MAGKTLHYRLNEKLTRKLEKLALQSRRTEPDVMRMLLEDATLDQLGVRQPQEKPA